MKRVTVLLLVLAMAMPAWVQTTKSPAQSNSKTLSTVTAPQSDQGDPDVKVWVNTNSGVYHCPGTRWYGKTKQGTYMTQAEAQKKDYRPAYGKVCR